MQIYSSNGREKSNQYLWISPPGLLKLATTAGATLCTFPVSLFNRAVWKLTHLAGHWLGSLPSHTHVFLPCQSVLGRPLPSLSHSPQDATEHPNPNPNHLLSRLPGSDVFLYDVANMDNFLLTVMAYDRYVAICHPLHYSTIMALRLCASLVAAPWVIAILNPLLHTLMMAHLHFCSDNVIHHFFCDINSLLPLSCSNTSLNQLSVLATVGLIFVVPSVCILVSYILIVSAVMKVPSAQGKLKAFSICGSHLALVILFYGAITGVYMSPLSNHSTEKDSAASVIFMVVAPVLNPFIYSLRNNKLKGTLKKTLSQRKIFSQWFIQAAGSSTGVIF